MIKTGILSTASIVPRVIEGIRSCEDFEICALASRDKEKALKASQIKKWLDENKDFTEALDPCAFEAAKTSPSGQSKVDLNLIKTLLKASGIKTNFTPSEILRCWLNKNNIK